MKAKIFSHNQLIGTTELQIGDKSMGGIFGDFIPTDFYYEKIQTSVWEFCESNSPNYHKWHSLRFNAQLENGVFLYPEGGYTIFDIKELPNEPKIIDITGVASEIITDFFLTEPPRPFVQKPWTALQIEQKIAFEDELQKELGTENKYFFDIFSKRSKHQLLSAELSAFCHDQRNDDVLFEFKNINLDKRFAVVHLTWKGKKEIEGYPITTFYADFDEFKYSKMYPDKIEWEG